MALELSPIEVTSVAGFRDRRAFRNLPFRLYAKDPHWVPPLHRDIAAFMNPQIHPFYRGADIVWFLARRGALVVGRIAAIECRAHNDFHREKTAFFGFFECENDPEVATALFDAAKVWARQRGMDRLRGPLSPSTNYECGLLVAGEPGLPVIMMAHNPAYYAQLIEQQGLSKLIDLYAFYLSQSMADLARWTRIADKVRARTGATLRPLDLKNFGAEVQRITELYAAAWSKNWGFVPMNSGEIERMAQELKPVIASYLAAFVVVNGRDVGFFLGLPDYNRVLKNLKGRLFPFGLFKLLASKHKIGFMRLLLMGVHPDHQHSGLDVMLYEGIWRQAGDHGIVDNESSWVLETNLPMINTMERVGARRYRTYRIYEGML